ncbi:hypothetical protein CBS9595_000353 [Malassezia furfur]|nr:hypothetical protein CBS9595_000353 [Malassezia furfur]
MSVVGSTDGPDDAELQVGGVARLTAQQGIQAIIAPMIEQGASEEEIKATVARARQFYYEHNTPAPTEATSASQRDAEAQPETSEPMEQYPASFNAIVELIATGQEDKIPGVRDIPLKINESEPSSSTLERPKKPWEASS